MNRVTVENIKSCEVFRLAFVELERENLLEVEGWEIELLTRARRIASALAKMRIWKGTQVGKSPYCRKKDEKNRRCKMKKERKRIILIDRMSTADRYVVQKVYNSTEFRILQHLTKKEVDDLISDNWLVEIRSA